MDEITTKIYNKIIPKWKKLNKEDLAFYKKYYGFKEEENLRRLSTFLISRFEDSFWESIPMTWFEQWLSYADEDLKEWHAGWVDFEDEFGTVGVNHIPQPSIKEWFYDFFPLIDEHNKHRQSLLQLEKKWPTKSCWFCLLTTLVGMCVVDMYRVYLNHDKNKYEKMDIIQFADEISLNLRPRTTKKAPTLAATLSTIQGQELRLERITNDSGETCQPPTDQ